MTFTFDLEKWFKITDLDKWFEIIAHPLFTSSI